MDLLQLDVKILDFEQIFDDVFIEEKLWIVILNKETSIKSEYIIRDKTSDQLSLENIETKEIIRWDRTKFIKNEYNILDIIRENLSDVLPSQVYTDTLESLQPHKFLVNIESQYIQKAEYAQIFHIDEQIAEITQYYLSKISNHSKLEKKAQSLGDLIDNYKQISRPNDNPIIDQIKYGHFYTPLLRPVVYDSKYIFPSKDDLDLFDIEDNRNFFRDENEDINIIKQLVELELNYEKNNQMTFSEYQEMLIYGGELPSGMTIKLKGEQPKSRLEPLFSSYMPIYKTDSDISMKGYKLNAMEYSDIYRYITPTNSYSLEGDIISQTRRTQGAKMILYDRPDRSVIGEKAGSRECFGTAKTSETKYLNPADPHVPFHDGIKSAFNKSITKEPEVNFATKGEELYIVGMYLKSPFSIQPPNNMLYKKDKWKKSDDIYYYIDNKNGWWNVMDRVIQSHQKSKKNDIIETTIDLTDINDPDKKLNLNYYQDNIIYFNTTEAEITRKEYKTQLLKIIPDMKEILRIEEDNIKNINNFTDLNKILSKYFLSHKNLEISQIKDLEKILGDSYLGYKESNEQEKIDYAFYKEMNIHIQVMFDDIYKRLFSIQKMREITEDDISTLVSEYVNKYDITQLDHILKFYFGLDLIYQTKEICINVFINQFYNRYSNYLYSQSPVRLLLSPNFSIEDPIVQKYTDFIKRYYNFDKMKHNPTNIGLINELYHNMFVKDSNEYFNYFADYVFATNGFYKIVTDEENLKKEYPSKKDVEEMISTARAALNREMVSYRLQHSKCLDYRISKFYSSMGQLLSENDKDILVDKVFDKTATINSIYKKYGVNGLTHIKLEYPHETDEWYMGIMEVLNTQGQLTGARVTDGMWALLVDGERYSLYERNNNKWEFKLNVPDISKVEIAFNKSSKQYKPPKNLAVLCNLEGRDADVVDEIAQLLNFDFSTEGDLNVLKNSKCMTHDNICLPKILVKLNKDIDVLTNVLKAFRYYEKQKDIYSSLSYDARKKLEIILKKTEVTVELKIITRKLEVITEDVNPQYKIYNQKWQAITKIPDLDVRYTEMKKFIENHGVFKRKLNKETGSLIKTDIDDWTHVYYNGLNMILCCRHYLELIKQAWQSNEEREQLQKSLEEHYHDEDTADRNISCKICGENIGLIKNSEFEGFDQNDQAIRVREFVQDFVDGEDDYSELFQDSPIQLDMYNNVLIELMTILNFKLNRDAIIEIIKNSDSIFQKSHLNLYEFEYAIFMSKPEVLSNSVISLVDANITVPDAKGKPHSMKWLEYYKKARNQLIPTQMPMTEQMLTSMGESKTLSFVKGNLLGKFAEFHKQYLAFHMVNALVVKLYAYLLLAEPEIQIKPSGERFSKSRISTINNYILNQRSFLEMFANVISSNAQSASIPDSIFLKYQNFFSKKINPSAINDQLIKVFIDNFLKNAEYVATLTIKEQQNRSELEQSKITVIESASWKTFRPILKLGDVSLELSRIDLNSIDQRIRRGTHRSQSEIQYDAFQLSYYLFYSIQQIIQAEVATAGQSFSNFCCLNPLKSNYIDYFKSQDANIDRCIELMKTIQPKAFYNPNQPTRTIYKDTIEIVPSKLLEYFQDSRRLLNETRLKEQITLLFKMYGLFENETREKRLYSKYYDEYLALIDVKSRSEIVDEIREKTQGLPEKDIQHRVNNLYNTTEAGLIREDIISEKFIWNITDKINDEINGKNVEELLVLYDTLVQNLNKSKKIRISDNQYESIPFGLEYDSIDKNKENFLKQYKIIFNEIIEELTELNATDIYSEFIQLNDRLQSKSSKDSRLDEIFKDFILYVAPPSGRRNPLEEIGIAIDITSLLNGCREAFVEKSKHLSNQIQIEGYITSEIAEQMTIRKNAIQQEYDYNLFEQLKRYYLIVIENISRFANYRKNKGSNYSFIGSSNTKRHKELSDNVNQGLGINVHIRDNKFKDLISEDENYERVTMEMIEQMNKFLSFEGINKIILAVNRSRSIDDQLIEAGLFEDHRNIYYIIYYFIQKSIANFINSTIGDREMTDFLRDFIKEFIMNELVVVSEMSCLTEKEVKNHLRDLIKTQNDKRRKRVSDMTPSRRMQYQLFRANGLGEFFPSDAVEDVDMAMILGMTEQENQEPALIAPQADDGDEIVAGDLESQQVIDVAQVLMPRRVDPNTDDGINEEAFGDDFDT
jgi:hypothetical protein